MTRSSTLSSQSQSKRTSDNNKSTRLNEAINRHIEFECASFHTPGHKGHLQSTYTPEPVYWKKDLTELPGLDDLSNPTGPIADLEAQAARLWQAQESIISINGASACLAAAMLAIAERGKTVLVPRNAHKSIVHGLVLSGLFPIWYDPVWDTDWNLWGPVRPTSVERILDRYGSDIAGLVIVSPTYAGAISSTKAISAFCSSHKIPLIADEAHGAHLAFGGSESAIASGADIVVHSLHKTLPALTQTGIAHVGKHSLVPASKLRSALRLLQTSSPSYLLLASIEQALYQIERSGEIISFQNHNKNLLHAVENLDFYRVYKPVDGFDPAHILIGFASENKWAHPDLIEELYNFLCQQGVFPETVLGQGILFMLGTGTSDNDIEKLADCLKKFASKVKSGEPAKREERDRVFRAGQQHVGRPPEIAQVLSPRQAFMLPHETVDLISSAGRISAESFAPCPPGMPLVVAGQRIPPELPELLNLKEIRVVVE